MFGFVNANPKSLSDEEKATYQAFYCGLCRELKKRGGKKCEILLNYDTVFLALLLSGLYEPPEQSFEFNCMMHPIKKREAFENEFISYAASAFKRRPVLKRRMKKMSIFFPLIPAKCLANAS